MNRHARLLFVFVQIPETRRYPAILGNPPFMNVHTAHPWNCECGPFQDSRADNNSEVCIHPSQNISSGGTVELLHVVDRHLKSWPIFSSAEALRETRA